jgi:hypothetical protein
MHYATPLKAFRAHQRLQINILAEPSEGLDDFDGLRVGRHVLLTSAASALAGYDWRSTRMSTAVLVRLEEHAYEYCCACATGGARVLLCLYDWMITRTAMRVARVHLPLYCRSGKQFHSVVVWCHQLSDRVHGYGTPSQLTRRWRLSVSFSRLHLPLISPCR